MEKEKLIELWRLLNDFEKAKCSKSGCCKNCICDLNDEPICALDKVRWEIEENVKNS